MRSWLVVAAASGLVVAGAAFGLASPAGADGSSSPLVGYNLSANAIGAQFAFNIPGLVPLPNANLIEEDFPFARTTAGSGPVVDSIGSPYFPGDILANLGGLESEFFPPQLPNTPWPVMARAEYPPNSAYGTSATFGGAAPAGSPFAPNVASGAANASQNGGNANGAITDIVVGPGLAPGGANLLEVASETTSDSVTLGTSTVNATASTVVKTIDVVGMVAISEIDSEANSVTDGTTGTPTASLHLGQVTVAGQPAYIDNTGVHVAGNPVSIPGVPTVAQLQSSLDQTLAQDGITIRLLDPQQTTNGAEATANSGGLVISISHDFSVPFINTGALTQNQLQPCIPTQDIGNNPISDNIPGLAGQQVLGNVCLPAGNYTAVTSITLGLATSDATANLLQSVTVPVNNLDNGTLSGLGGTGLTDLTSQTSLGTVSGPGVGSSNASAPGFGTQLLHFPIRGVPAPVGWVVLGLILCLLFSYPMMLAARWQFLVGRR